jgi:UTP--glucose-1-phosphate uridylyltransferase
MKRTDLVSRFAPFKQRMLAANLPEIVIENFKHLFRQVLEGETGLIPDRDIQPVNDLPDISEVGAAYRSIGGESLTHTALIKLNGGLGTSMGMSRAKSLIRVKDGLSFLEIAAQQAAVSRVPLVLMNSFATHADSCTALARSKEESQFDLEWSFLQHKFPKIRRDNLAPACCPEWPGLEWNPPGHGDIYLALVTSGMLEKLLSKGFRYAFISNVDNLGAVLDEALLGYLVKNCLPFLMEVADRTPADRKGGHLARRRDGRLILRESAQCPEAEIESFQDISRFRYFNTNSIWLNLLSLQETLAANDNVLDLALIRNDKTLNPRDPASTSVFQLETAMGSAISVFAGAEAIRVPRSRFAPVKTTADLLVVQSDLYRLDEKYRLAPASTNAGIPEIKLDQRFYKLIDDYEARFPDGAPSLRSCARLEIRGDVGFSRNVTVQGSVVLENRGGDRVLVPAGAELTRDRCWPDPVPA